MEYIKSVCNYLLIGTLLTNMFPNDKYVQYVKMIFGFLLIAMLINPICKVLFGNIDLQSVLYEFSIENMEYSYDSYNVEEMSRNLQEYGQIINDRIMEYETGGAEANEQSPGKNQ